MNKAVLLLMLLGVCVSIAKDGAASPLSATERKELGKLEKKDPPDGLADKDAKLSYKSQYEALKAENKALKEKQNQLNREIDKLQNNDIKLLDGDIYFYNSKIKRLEQNRENTIDGMAENRGNVNQFNRALMRYVSEQLDNSGYIVLGVPAFDRKDAYKKSTYSSRLLVVNMDYSVKAKSYVIGGEFVTSGMGKAQFVVLHKREEGSYEVEKAGNEITITEADKDADGDFFKKKLLFTDNFAEIGKDDLWGLVIDAEAGLKYDSFATGSSYVVDYNGEGTVKWSENNLQGKNAFSFCLFVQVID